MTIVLNIDVYKMCRLLKHFIKKQCVLHFLIHEGGWKAFANYYTF